MGNLEQCNYTSFETKEDILTRKKQECRAESISQRKKLLSELFSDGRNDIKSLSDIDNLMKKYNFSLSEEDRNSIEVGDTLFIKVVGTEVFLTLEKSSTFSKGGKDFMVLTAITKQDEVRKTKNDVENNYSKMKLEEFLALPKEKRLEILTSPINNGYLKLNFPNEEIEKGVKLKDILPDNFNVCEILRSEDPKATGGNKTKFGVKKFESSNYYDLLGKDISGEYASLLSGKPYQKGFELKSGYIIKPNYSDIRDLPTIFSDDPQKTDVYNPSAQTNEKAMRNMFGRLISDGVNELKKERPDSIIDENFVYAIIAQESKFDPNAISGGNAMGLGQIIRSTGLPEILLRNNLKASGDDSVFVKNLLDFGSKFLVEKKGQKYNVSGVGTKLFDPETSIKLIISYLYIVEGYFKNVKDTDYRRKLIACGYNAGPGSVLEAIKSDTTPKNWDWVTKRLKIALGRQKANEASNYAQRVSNYYAKAGSITSQQLAMNS